MVTQHAVERRAHAVERTEVDIGTRKGLLVSGRKVKEASLEVLDEIRLGGVTLLVEDIVPGPEKVPSQAVEEVPAAGPPRITDIKVGPDPAEWPRRRESAAGRRVRPAFSSKSHR